jgi:ATP-dependent DNA helicase RecG
VQPGQKAIGMNILTLSDEYAAKFVAQWLPADETSQLEFKRVSGKMVGKAIETLCAFANADGGLLVLGLADLKEYKGTARIFGVEENAEAVDELVRKLRTEFLPPLRGVQLWRLPCNLHNGPAKSRQGHLMVVRVLRSAQVHSLAAGGTYTRLHRGNRELTAEEITELSYRRGTRSAAAEPVPIALERLNTQAWHRFLQRRGPLSGSFTEQMLSIGLAMEIDGGVQPLRAAVLLFADEPGGLLAAHGTRADVRVFVYDGKAAVPSATPNLRKEPKTIRGPLIDQIDRAVTVVMDELAQGVTLSGSGFRTRHLYPERVVKEAIVNAVVHRDYRLNRDTYVRIFDDHIEIESPGLLPKGITPATIRHAGSKTRNDLIAANLRDFPEPPNLDAGEGVRMMFAEMARAQLYPPQYRENTAAAVESLTVVLLNHERPTAWDEVSNWLDRHGTIANADVVRIAGVDTLRASKLLAAWREQGLLVPLPGRAKRNMAYAKSQVPPVGEVDGLFTEAAEKNLDDSEKLL